MLAFVQSLAMQSFEKGEALQTYSTRLSALGRVQGLIGKSDSDRVDLREIVQMEIESLGTAAEGRVTLNGSPVSLSHEHIQTLALALARACHQRAQIRGFAQSETWPPGDIDLAYCSGSRMERQTLGACNGLKPASPIPPDTTRRGFGRHLIERALAAQHAGEDGSAIRHRQRDLPGSRFRC